jgi:hypothetical protein
MLRHASYAVSVVPLPVRLRRTDGNPYVLFLIVAVSDFFSLVLTLNAVINWGTGGLASWDWLSDISKGILFGSLFDILRNLAKGVEPQLRDVLLSVAGVLYARTLLGSAYHFWEFRREDDDYRVIAQARCLLGQYNEALKALGKVRSTEGVTRSTRGLMAAAYLGVNQLDRAWENARQSLDESAASSPEVFSALARLTVAFPFPQDTLIALLERGIGLPASDARVLDAIDQFSLSGARCETMMALFAEPSVADRLPLSYADLLMMSRDEANIQEARRRLDMAKPQSDVERILQLFLSMFASTAADPDTTLEQDAVVFNSWSRSYSNQVSDLISAVSKSAVSNNDECIILLGRFLLVVLLAERMKSSYEQAWRFTFDQLRHTVYVKQPEVTEWLVRIEARLRMQIA